MTRKRSVWRHPDLLKLARESRALDDRLAAISPRMDQEGYQRALDALNRSYAAYNDRRRELQAARARAGHRTYL